MTKERLRIWGPPGTGKTSHLIKITEDEMARGYRPDEIVFSSFTRAAAHEARRRAMTRFGGDKDEYPFFATEHAICFRLLGLGRDQIFTRRWLREFGIQNQIEYSEHTDKTINRYPEAMLSTKGDYFEFFLQFMRNSQIPIEDAYVKFKRQNDIPVGFSLQHIYQYIEKRDTFKQQHKLWDFTDMIVGVLQRGMFPETMKVLILDEMQDSSRLLWSLAELWSKQAEKVYIAGDPLQTLYFWSGASPELFFGFEAEEEILRTSYRLTNEIKDYSERVINDTSYTFPDFKSSGREGSVTKEIFSGIDWENTGSAFVLFRTRYTISKIIKYFMGRGIPFTTDRGSSPFNSIMSNAFHSLIKLRYGEDISNIEIANLVKFMKKPYLSYGTKANAQRLADGRYGKYPLAQIGFTDDFFIKLKTDQFTDILNYGVSSNDKKYLLDVFSRYGREVFEHEPNLMITTIHGSKGMERPTVFVSPDITQRVWVGYLNDRNPEALVYYVACTRAIDSLVILVRESNYVYPLPKIGEENGNNSDGRTL